MSTRKTLTIVLATLFSSAVMAQEAPLSNSIEIGTVDSVKKSFAAQHANARSMVAHSIAGNLVAAKITDYFEKGDALSISGTALDTSNSTFVLKGKGKKLYGYLVNYDTAKA